MRPPLQRNGGDRMNQENKKNKKGFEVNTPLEYIGFGFLFMLIVSIFLSIAMQTGYDGFQECMLGTYLIICGPFIVYGISQLLAEAGAETFKYVTVWSSALAHYSGFFSIKWLDNWDCFLVFLAVYICAPIIGIVFKRIRKKTN